MLLNRRKKVVKVEESTHLYNYGIVIAARNEENVIGYLIDSIHKQSYPMERIRIYVIADNCTDQTASVARENGAIVFERSNTQYVGKGYALNNLFHCILKTDSFCDAFIILDADNLLTKNYIEEMNKTYNNGFRVITSYRNSKNYGSNWISAGTGLWFLRESKYINNARLCLKTSCAISGTGFLIKRELIEKEKSWNYFLLTEDLEFTVDHIIRGEKIGYCPQAIFFDEQPITFKQSWNQRLRWAKGFYQVLGKYGLSLVKGIFTKHSFACFDMLLFIFPASLLSLLILMIYSTKLINILLLMNSPMFIIRGIIPILLNFLFLYLFLYVLGLITTITEWQKIHCRAGKKILYTFTFPLFMFTYIPITLVASFTNVTWKPIKHPIGCSVEQVQSLKYSELTGYMGNSSKR
jgi:cellulose synthase/poly-beta-1,6-N-acetylglucosamine synthase-like glycosyltransferase